MESSFDLARLDATATHLRLSNGLTMDSLVVEASDVRFREDGSRLAGTAKAVARLSAASVQAFLVKQVPPMVKDVRVALESGHIVVRATATLMLTVDVTVNIALDIRDGTKLVAVVASVEPGLARKIIEDEIEKGNPLLDAADLPLPVNFDSVEVGTDAIHLTASVTTD